jgi:hypothetical protein
MQVREDPDDYAGTPEHAYSVQHGHMAALRLQKRRCIEAGVAHVLSVHDQVSFY